MIQESLKWNLNILEEVMTQMKQFTLIKITFSTKKCILKLYIKKRYLIHHFRITVIYVVTFKWKLWKKTCWEWSQVHPLSAHSRCFAIFTNGYWRQDWNSSLLQPPNDCVPADNLKGCEHENWSRKKTVTFMYHELCLRINFLEALQKWLEKFLNFISNNFHFPLVLSISPETIFRSFISKDVLCMNTEKSKIFFYLYARKVTYLYLYMSF